MAILPLLAGAGAAYGGYQLAKSGLNYLFPGKQQVNSLNAEPNGNFLTGYNAQNQQLPRFDQQQQNLLGQLGQGALQGLQQAPNDFAPIENLARKKYAEETIPLLAQRLQNAGAGPLTSGFRGAITGSAADLEAQLAALRSQHGFQQRGQLLQQASLGLQPSFENIYIPQTSGLLGAAAPGLGLLGASALSNPETAGSIGSSIGGALSTPGLGTAGLAGVGAGAGLAGLLALYNYLQGNKGQQLGGAR